MRSRIQTIEKIKANTNIICSQDFVKSPLVSLILSAYNVKTYINEAIQNVINQVTGFSFELIISDDASNDGTSEVILDYYSKYPSIIKILKSKSNVGHNLKGLALLTIRNLDFCRGDFITFLDGDDYWKDPYKLQKQVNFMQNSPAYSMSFHDRRILYYNKTNNDGTLLPEKMKKTLTHQDLIMCNTQCPPTCTMMFRKTTLLPLPDWFAKTICGDRMLSIISTQKGLCGYIPDIEPSVYRVHDESITQGLNKTISSLLDIESRLQIMKLDQDKVSLDYHCFKINQIIKILISDYKFLTLKQKIKTTVLIIKFVLIKPSEIFNLLPLKKEN